MATWACGCSCALDARGGIAWRVCGEEFCPTEAMVAAAEELREHNMLQRELAPPPARPRPRPAASPHDCDQCGEPVPPERGPRLRCSAACDRARSNEYQRRRYANDAGYRDRQQRAARERTASLRDAQP